MPPLATNAPDSLSRVLPPCCGDVFLSVTAIIAASRSALWLMSPIQIWVEMSKISSRSPDTMVIHMACTWNTISGKQQSGPCWGLGRESVVTSTTVPESSRDSVIPETQCEPEKPFLAPRELADPQKLPNERSTTHSIPCTCMHHAAAAAPTRPPSQKGCQCSCFELVEFLAMPPISSHIWQPT